MKLGTLKIHNPFSKQKEPTLNEAVQVLMQKHDESFIKAILCSNQRDKKFYRTVPGAYRAAEAIEKILGNKNFGVNSEKLLELIKSMKATSKITAVGQSADIGGK